MFRYLAAGICANKKAAGKKEFMGGLNDLLRDSDEEGDL